MNTFTPIPDKTIEIIKHSRKALLFHNNKTWQKQDSLFDVTMGSLDGSEICEAVGLFILDKMKRAFPNMNCGLYRDDGLIVIKKCRKQKIEQFRKSMFKIFKDMGLQITIDANLEQVNFLDVTININGNFWPYQKPNSDTKYVHVDSNHPKVVLKEIPNSVNARLSNISSNENLFNKHKQHYEKALKDSGHNSTLKYNTPNQEQNRRKRNRKVVWYNPPYNKALKTNIGKEFIKLIDKHFHSKNPLSKQFNRHTIKLSYSCTPNMAKIIAGHNKKILREEDKDKKMCNCQNKDKCPMGGKCLSDSIVYRAELKVGENTKNYIGMTDGAFKTRYRNHKNSFTNINKKQETALSKVVWDLGANGEPNVSWTILKKCNKYAAGMKMCSLCLSEKLQILNACNDKDNVNKKSEAISLCVHRNKYKLANWKQE